MTAPMQCRVFSPCGRFTVLFECDGKNRLHIEVRPNPTYVLICGRSSNDGGVARSAGLPQTVQGCTSGDALTSELRAWPSPEHYLSVTADAPQIAQLTSSAGVRKSFAGFAEMAYNALIGRAPCVTFHIETVEQMNRRVAAEMQCGEQLAALQNNNNNCSSSCAGTGAGETRHAAECDLPEAACAALGRADALATGDGANAGRTLYVFTVDYNVDFTQAIFAIPLEFVCHASSRSSHTTTGRPDTCAGTAISATISTSHEAKESHFCSADAVISEGATVERAGVVAELGSKDDAAVPMPSTAAPHTAISASETQPTDPKQTDHSVLLCAGAGELTAVETLARWSAHRVVPCIVPPQTTMHAHTNPSAAASIDLCDNTSPGDHNDNPATRGSSGLTLRQHIEPTSPSHTHPSAAEDRVRRCEDRVAQLERANAQLSRENAALKMLSKEKMLEMQRLCADFEHRVHDSAALTRLRARNTELRVKLQEAQEEARALTEQRTASRRAGRLQQQQQATRFIKGHMTSLLKHNMHECSAQDCMSSEESERQHAESRRANKTDHYRSATNRKGGVHGSMHTSLFQRAHTNSSRHPHDNSMDEQHDGAKDGEQMGKENDKPRRAYRSLSGSRGHVSSREHARRRGLSSPYARPAYSDRCTGSFSSTSATAAVAPLSPQRRKLLTPLNLSRHTLSASRLGTRAPSAAAAAPQRPSRFDTPPSRAASFSSRSELGHRAQRRCHSPHRFTSCVSQEQRRHGVHCVDKFPGRRVATVGGTAPLGRPARRRSESLSTGSVSIDREPRYASAASHGSSSRASSVNHERLYRTPTSSSQYRQIRRAEWPQVDTPPPRRTTLY